MYSISIRAIICDAPARSFILNIINHSGYNSCHKCNIEGNYVLHRVVFPTNSYPKKAGFQIRTHEHFIQKLDSDHHTNKTKLVIEDLNIDCISNVPIDPMHAAFLGVTRQLVYNLILVRLHKFSVSTKNIELISERIVTAQLPFEFNRKLRPLLHI